MFKNHSASAAAFSFLALSSLLVAACTFDTTNYIDYLHASATVTANDGQTPVPNLPIEQYDWIVSYTDGSTVSVPFQPALATDAAGQFKFDSNQLSLQSGKLAESCTQVCTDYDTGYEDVCTDWETTVSDGEEYCESWDTDSDGNEYCSSWGYVDGTSDTYCVNWEEREYSYCSQYGQDCTYYYPSRNIKDITTAYSEITYPVGAARVTTQSQYSTLAADGAQSMSTTLDHTTTVTAQWTQNDRFITPFTAVGTGLASREANAPARAKSSPKFLTPKQAEIVALRNAAHRTPKMKRSGTPHFGRTHQPSKVLPAPSLNPAQLIKLELARKAFGATPIVK